MRFYRQRSTGLTSLLSILAMSAIDGHALSQEEAFLKRRQFGTPEIDAKLELARKSSDAEAIRKAEEKRARKAAKRHAFTLVEFLILLAICIAVSGMVWSWHLAKAAERRNEQQQIQGR